MISVPGLRTFPAAWSPLAAGLCALWLAGCANGSLTRYDKVAKAMGGDRYAQAINAIEANPSLYGENNRALYHMDLGLLFHYAGRYDSSVQHLSVAVKDLDALYTRSVTNEAAALLTNDNLRPYRSKPYEIVLLHEFLALDYLALGKPDEALVETRQTQLFFDAWRKENPKAKPPSAFGLFEFTSALAYEAAGERDNSLISLYHAVEDYRQSEAPLPRGLNDYAYARFASNDRHDDIEKLRLEAPAAAGNGQDTGAEIVFVGYAGKAPTYGETVFWGTWVRDGMLVFHYQDPVKGQVTEALPAPGLPPAELAGSGRHTRSGTTLHIKFAIPSLQPVPSRTRGFAVAVDGANQGRAAVPMADVDAMAARNLEDTKASTVTRTALRVVVRTLAAQKTKAALNTGNPILNLLLNVGTDVLADQMEQADTRTCFLLPKTIQVLRVPVAPGTHTLSVAAEGAGGSVVAERAIGPVQVRPGEKKFVFFPSLQ